MSSQSRRNQRSTRANSLKSERKRIASGKNPSASRDRRKLKSAGLKKKKEGAFRLSKPNVSKKSERESMRRSRENGQSSPNRAGLSMSVLRRKEKMSASEERSSERRASRKPASGAKRKSEPEKS